MNLTDLTFEPHIPNLGSGGLISAAVTFANGYSVSIVFGRLSMPHWEPGLFEAAILSPTDGELLHDSIVRGDADTMDALLARVEAFPPPFDVRSFLQSH